MSLVSSFILRATAALAASLAMAVSAQTTAPEPLAAWATAGKPTPESNELVRRLSEWGHATRSPHAFMVAARVVLSRTMRSGKLGGNIEEQPLVQSLLDQAARYADGDPDIVAEIADLRAR